MGLHFYRSEYLGALVFLGVLVLIHLLRRPKTISLKFSTLQFFGINSVNKNKSRKLRRLLLLCTRLLLATLIVFLFARPYSSHDKINRLTDPNVSLFVWIDHSPSMDYSDGTSTIGIKAIELIDSLAGLLPLSVKKYIFDYYLNDFTEYQRGAINFESHHGPVNLDHIFQKVSNNKFYNSQSVFLLVSDYQEGTSNEVDSLINRTQLKNDIVCASITPDSPWNFYIKKAVLNSEASVDVQIGATGRSIQSARIVVTSGDFHTVPVSVYIEKDSTAKVRIPFAWDEYGAYSVQIDENDPLTFDNIYALNSESQSGGGVTIIGNVEDNFVIAAALKASGEAFWHTIYMRDCNAVSSEEIDNSSLIIVNNSGKPCPVLEKIISTPGTVNKTVLYCMGTDSAFGVFNDSAILNNAIPELPQMKSSGVSSPVFPVLPDTMSGLWYGFPGKYEQMVKITSYIRPLPGTALCYLSDGGVLFSTIIDKRGLRWIFSSTPLGRNAPNNLWKSGMYVPMLDRLGRFARSQVLSATNIVAGYPVRNPLFNSSKDGLIYDSDGKPYLVPDNPHIIFRNPGIYKVIVKGEPAQIISVNADTAESKMVYHEPLKGNTSHENVTVCTSGELIEMIHRKSGDIHFYILWILCALMLIAEILLWEKKRSPDLGVTKVKL